MILSTRSSPIHEWFSLAVPSSLRARMGKRKTDAPGESPPKGREAATEDPSALDTPFRTVAEKMLYGMCAIRDVRITYANETFARIFGYTREQLYGLDDLERLVDPEDRSFALDQIRRGLEGEGAVKDFRIRGRTRDGDRIHLQLFGQRFTHAGSPVLILTVLDVTTQVELEREVIRVREEERRNLAHNLHDGVGSQLTGALMMLAGVGNDLRNDRPLEPDEFEEIVELLRSTLEDVHRFAQGLAPVQIEDFGLVEVLRQLAARIDHHRVDCRFEVDRSVPDSMTDSVASHLYAIAQEASTNALKYARADEIKILLERDESHLTLTVTDDGTGIEEMGKAGGLGLRTMDYRADLIGAELDVSPRSEGGTRVRCRISL